MLLMLFSCLLIYSFLNNKKIMKCLKCMALSATINPKNSLPFLYTHHQSHSFSFSFPRLVTKPTVYVTKESTKCRSHLIYLRIKIRALHESYPNVLHLLTFVLLFTALVTLFTKTLISWLPLPTKSTIYTLSSITAS